MTDDPVDHQALQNKATTQNAITHTNGIEAEAYKYNLTYRGYWSHHWKV